MYPGTPTPAAPHRCALRLGDRVMPQTFRALRCAECGAFQVHLEGKSPKWSCTLCNTKQSLTRVYATGAAKDVRRVVQDLNAARGEAYQSAQATAHASGEENRRWQQPPPPPRPQQSQHFRQTSEDGFATALPDQGGRNKQKRVRNEADEPPPPQRHQTVPGLHHGCEQQHQHNGWRSQHDEWHPREDTFHEPYSKPYGEPYGKYGKCDSFQLQAHSAGTYHSSRPSTHEPHGECHVERHGVPDVGYGRGRSERADVHCFTSAPSEEVEEEVWQG